MGMKYIAYLFGDLKSVVLIESFGLDDYRDKPLKGTAIKLK